MVVVVENEIDEVCFVNFNFERMRSHRKNGSKDHLALGRAFLERGLKRATIGPVGLRPHFLNRGPRPGPIAAVKTQPQTDQI